MSVFEGSTASTVTSSLLSSLRLVLIGVEVWGWSKGDMGIPASARAAWEKTGALTGRVPLCVITTEQNTEKEEMNGTERACHGLMDKLTWSHGHRDKCTRTVISIKMKQSNISYYTYSLMSQSEETSAHTAGIYVPESVTPPSIRTSMCLEVERKQISTKWN